MNATGSRNRRPRWVQAAAFLMGACDPASEGPREVTVAPDAMRVFPSLDVVTRVVDSQPTGDGRVWVLNSAAPYFVILGPDGQVERRFGERGGGPEEFGAPVALVRGPSPADFWTYDAQRNALIRISATNGRLGQGSDWLHVSADGSHTSVALPRAFRTFRLDRDRIWGTVPDTLGVESIAWIGLDELR